MKIVSGNLGWLPVLSNIQPPAVRREIATNKPIDKFIDNEDSLLFMELKDVPRMRLNSRKPIFAILDHTNFDPN